MDFKRCIGCGESKPLSEFYSTMRGRPGRDPRREYASRCKLCHKAQTKQYDYRNPRNPRTTPEERFWSRVNKGDDTGCWLWTGSLNADGRPTFMGPNNRDWLAQRYAWESLNGPAPDRTPFRPDCGTALCVRPDHMLAVRFPSYDPHMTKKRCSICKEMKPVSAFGGRGSGSAGARLSGRCKECNSIYLKAYSFGLSPDDIRRMMDDQGGRCAICGRTADEAGIRSLSVDHCHDESGKVRALLCGQCNSAMGLLGEDPARMRAMADYIERWTQPTLTVSTPKMNLSTVA